VHPEQEVLPSVPVRHWVCTFPWGVRAALGFDKELCGKRRGRSPWSCRGHCGTGRSRSSASAPSNKP
jgi:hypothetical protein